MTTPHENPLGTKGFAFVEFASPRPQELVALFERFGFQHKGTHKTRNIKLYAQGDVRILVNDQAGTHGAGFAKAHGPSVPSMGWLMADAAQAHKGALARGAENFADTGAKAIDAPAITGIGGSLIYFVDSAAWESAFDTAPGYAPKTTAGLQFIDHLTHNVRYGQMDRWFAFYRDIFNFHEIRNFDIKGEQTGLVSYAITSPCGNITIPINESDDAKSQINEYLERYQGEGIQHIALHTADILGSIDYLRGHGQKFLDVPDTYYDAVNSRVSNYAEKIEDLRKRGILIDGEKVDRKAHGEYLLQLFTTDVVGPVFFEIISRKGHHGFGEGNFTALFEAIERDQIKRGYLNAK